ncbi:MAG: esterase/lipase family protein [Egibacteraceae bacterium]
MRLRHLIVVIPGIGGSVLERAGEPVWGDGLLRAAQRMCDPAALALFPGDGVRAVGLIRSAWILPGWAVMHGYERLVHGICNSFEGAILDEGHPDCRVPDANVVLFPYDFRQSVEVAAELLAAEVKIRLNGLGERDQRRRVVVVAHSMGGLVARYWLGPLEGWRCCRALVTLGTPHRGAPKALAWLASGVRLKGVRLPAATKVIRGWPSVYELLPRYPAVIRGQTGKTCYPYELAVKGFDHARAAGAFELHKKIEAAWDEVGSQRDAPKVTPFLGCGHPTLERASWGNALSVTKDPADWLGQEDWFGDGTVPAYAASPIEQAGVDEERWRYRPVRHGPLVWDPEVVKEVVELLTGLEAKSTTPVRGKDGRLSLGVDVEEWYPAGEAVPVEVFLRRGRETLGAASGVRVWASVSPEGGGQVSDVELERAGDRWVGELGGFPPGSYRLTVSATGVPDGEPRPVQEVFGVVDPSAVDLT